MSKANFTHRIEKYSGQEVIVIEDLNMGNMSVTNDIENVINDIEMIENIDAHSMIIVYRDSEGVWDGFDYENGDFISLNKNNWRAAVHHYMKNLIPQ
jgi:hypothetical protein